MKQRCAQLTLRLDSATPDLAAQWRDGAALPYLGGQLTLQLDTDRTVAVRDHDILHLPLPPAASTRQIRDGVEAWLRKEAACLIGASIARQADLLGRPAPRWSLSFAARSSWVSGQSDGSLRCNWRLIEQPGALIDQSIRQALAALPVAHSTADFWEMQPA